MRFDGVVEEFRYLPDKPESEVFVEALKPVARSWIFRTPIDNDCLPTLEVVRTEVSFEIDNGSPRISSPMRRLPWVPRNLFYRTIGPNTAPSRITREACCASG